MRAKVVSPDDEDVCSGLDRCVVIDVGWLRLLEVVGEWT